MNSIILNDLLQTVRKWIIIQKKLYHIVNFNNPSYNNLTSPSEHIQPRCCHLTLCFSQRLIHLYTINWPIRFRFHVNALYTIVDRWLVFDRIKKTREFITPKVQNAQSLFDRFQLIHFYLTHHLLSIFRTHFTCIYTKSILKKRTVIRSVPFILLLFSNFIKKNNK